MTIISIISLSISLLLQGLISNIQNFTPTTFSFLGTVFILINFIVLQHYYESDKKFLLIIIIFGLLFDITYSNTLILCTTLFILIFYLNKMYSFLFPTNILTINIFSLLAITIYHTLIFILLKILQFDTYSIKVLIKVICSNLLMTMIYTSIIYYIIDLLSKKFNLKKIRD